jgi:hypothetical protein
MEPNWVSVYLDMKMREQSLENKKNLREKRLHWAMLSIAMFVLGDGVWHVFII